MMFIVQSEEAIGADQVGGKAFGLAVLQRACLPVPAWFALLPSAFDASLSIAQREALAAATNDTDMSAIVAEITPSEAVRLELARALAGLCPAGERVAVRSSACDEDGTRQSFSGQFDSFLNVPHDEVARRVAAVWRSGFSARLRAYRCEHGLVLPLRPPAVLIQQMVNAEAAGVAFSADPVSGRRGIAVVAAGSGLGAELASGETDADTYRVDRDGHVVKQEIAGNQAAPNGVSGIGSAGKRAEITGPGTRNPVVDEAQIRAVADLARLAERCFGRPQDIEWAMAGGCLYLLQSRPITTLAHMPDPDGILQIWDNSNIIESYSGVTTPLTFSFARHVYEEVYRQFCRLLQVPRAAIAANDNTFRHMLGLIQGRVYYNLLNWYRALALLPGFTVNRRFMEQMMGVREGLPEPILAELKSATWRARFWDGLHLLGSVVRLMANHVMLPRHIQRFKRRLDAALAPVQPPLEAMRADEIAAYYRDLESQLLTRWDAPLLNDFFTMIHFGMLRRLTTKWCGDDAGTLQNDLISGEGGMISAEPPQRIREMAETAAGDSEFVEVLCEGRLDAINRAMQTRPEFTDLYRAYLARFGDRCLEELKLESPTLHDDPLPLLRAIGQLARSGSPPSKVQTSTQEGTPRCRAERRVWTALARHPMRRLVFWWTLRNVREKVRNRENLRFERTRLFGRVRRIFVELGRRFHAVDLLDEPHDVFYLEVGEVLGILEGTATCADLRGLAAVRKAEFDAYRVSPAPPDRFETRGFVLQGNTSWMGREIVQTVGDRRTGIGCCPGVARGPVRVIADPRTAELCRGAILVAERTDPGWILLFSGITGLLVERGSLLSHSAIVAREMGIPTIVSLPGVTHWLQNGDCVEMDGSSGTVCLIARMAEGKSG